jgi:hypothetical protein
MDFQSFGKILIGVAAALALVGALMWVGGRLGLGNLPGDFRFERGGWSCFIPIASSILLSIVLTLLLNLLFRWFGGGGR